MRESEWTKSKPMDDGARLAQQAAMVKAINPRTHVWVYRESGAAIQSACLLPKSLKHCSRMNRHAPITEERVPTTQEISSKH